MMRSRPARLATPERDIDVTVPKTVSDVDNGILPQAAIKQETVPLWEFSTGAAIRDALRDELDEEADGLTSGVETLTVILCCQRC